MLFRSRRIQAPDRTSLLLPPRSPLTPASQNCLFSTPSCICRLATPSSLESLDALLATLRTMPLPTRLKTPPTDISSLLAFCKTGVADRSLSGGVWRSAKAWKAKVPVLARVFDDVFESVVREGKTEVYDQAWLDVARAVGGVETYAMSQRAELEGGEECESWKSWMCFIGTGSGMEEGEGAEEERRVTAERRRELVSRVWCFRVGRELMDGAGIGRDGQGGVCECVARVWSRGVAQPRGSKALPRSLPRTFVNGRRPPVRRLSLSLLHLS